MKIIDLLNKIANGEEVPKEIKHWNKNYRYDSFSTHYEQIGGFDSLFKNLFIYEHDLQKCLNDEVEILEEEKKIPEKLDVIGWDKCIHNVTHKEKELAIEINKTQKLLNQVIDFLKSKGE